ncbi:MAG TPA: mechanosensitive ion channel [Steroidobacteraceae bacterium]|nr:mechanosensitive ion channel [Steroidobacteraceae bacterium]
MGKVERSLRASLAALRIALSCTVALATAAVAGGADAGGAQAPAAGAPAVDESTQAVFAVANRPIFTLRASLLGATPAERVAASEHRLDSIVKHGGPLVVSTRDVDDGVALLVDGKFVVRVLTGDVDPESGESELSYAAAAAHNLRKALAEIREANDARAIGRAVAYALAASVLLAVSCWVLLRAYRWLAARVHAAARRRLGHLLPAWADKVIGEAALGGLLTVPFKLLVVVAIALLGYEWAGYVLQRFPYTRPWGEQLSDNLFEAAGRLLHSVLSAIPGLLFVVFIFVAARILVRAVRAFFSGVEQGQIHVELVEKTTARPTGRLVTTAIWLFALVAAYPYIPGSGSEAFRGIGVFVGLMVSIGASGVVNQAVSGLMLMYTKALRPGEFVKVGDVEGTVTSVGFVATRIETLRHEEVNVPNSVIATNVMHNYSRLSSERGLWLPATVTIGYDAPWRQVHAMLTIAAERTEGVAHDPAPRVHQTALQDFYVEYTLLVNVAVPRHKREVLTRLYANIQDVFNEHGVQIMSPNYEDDPESPKIVPKEKWYEPPAARPE